MKVSDSDQDGLSDKKAKKKETKKRKSSDIDGLGEKRESSSELVEPKSSRAKSREKRNNNKKPKFEEPDMGGEELEKKKKDPNATSNFRISEPLRAKLKEKGIESLFPIQARTFDTILDGSDLVGRARTGQVCSLF